MAHENRSRCCLGTVLAGTVLAGWLLAVIVSVFLFAFFMLYIPSWENAAVDIGGNYTVALHEDGFNSFWTAGLKLSLTENDEFATLEDLSLYTAPCKDTTTMLQTLPTVSRATVFSISKQLGLNYHGGDVPLYSAAGGHLNYTFNTTSVFDSTWCFDLHIFDNYESYHNFINDGSTVGSILDTGCLESGTNYTSVSISIDTSSFYYVAATMYVEESQPITLNYSVTPELEAYDLSGAGTVSHKLTGLSCQVNLPEHSAFSPHRICVYCQSQNYTSISVVTDKRRFNRGSLLFLVLTAILAMSLILSCSTYAALNMYGRVPLVLKKIVSGHPYNLYHDQVRTNTSLLMLSDSVV